MPFGERPMPPPTIAVLEERAEKVAEERVGREEGVTFSWCSWDS